MRLPELGLSGGNDLDPVAIRIGDKINPHGRIFKADTAHLLMLFMGSLIVIGPQCQMELALAQIILLGMIPQPCQFQAEIRFSVSQIDDDKAAVRRLFALSPRLQAQGILVKP